MRWVLSFLAAVVFATSAAVADPVADCEQNADYERQISGCTELIDQGRLPAGALARVHQNRGVAFHSLGQDQRAIADYDHALDLNPEFSVAYLNRGTAYQVLGEYRRAIADFDQGIALTGGVGVAYNSRGYCYVQIGEYELAIVDFDQATALVPSWTMPHYNRGNARKHLGKYQSAIADYDRAIALAPDFAEAYDARGHSQEALAEIAAAIADYRKALDLDPTLEGSRQGLARLISSGGGASPIGEDGTAPFVSVEDREGPLDPEAPDAAVGHPVELSGARRDAGAIISETTDASFEKDVIERSRLLPVLVYFDADWCGPCRDLRSALEAEAIRHRGAIALVRIDVDQDQQVAASIGIGSIPTVYAFHDGKAVDHFAGALSAARVAAFVQDVLEKRVGAATEGDAGASAIEPAEARAFTRNTAHPVTFRRLDIPRPAARPGPQADIRMDIRLRRENLIEAATAAGLPSQVLSRLGMFCDRSSDGYELCNLRQLSPVLHQRFEAAGLERPRSYGHRFYAPKRFTSTVFDDAQTLFCELDKARNLYVFDGRYFLIGLAQLGLEQVFPRAALDELDLRGCDTDPKGNIYAALRSSHRSDSDGVLIKFSPGLRDVMWVTPRMTASAPPVYVNGRLFTAHGGTGIDDYLFEIDPETGQVIGREPVPSAIRMMVPYGNSILVRGYDYGWVIDLPKSASWAPEENTTTWTFSVQGPQLLNRRDPEGEELRGVFSASVHSPRGRATEDSRDGVRAQEVSFGCAGGYEKLNTDYFEGIGPTRPYELDFVIWNDVLPIDGLGMEYAVRDDIILVSENVHTRLGQISPNLMAGGWRVSLRMTDRLIQALLAGGKLDIWAGEEVLASYGAEGLAEGLAAAIRYCDVHWSRQGLQVPFEVADLITSLRRTYTPAPVPPGTSSLVSHALKTAVEDRCGGPAEIATYSLFENDFDRDGLTDIALFWGGVSCMTGEWADRHGAGQCGAANCLVHIFVSSALAAGEDPIETYAIGIELDPEKPKDLISVGDNAACMSDGREGGCTFRLRWDGTDFSRVD